MRILVLVLVMLVVGVMASPGEVCQCTHEKELLKDGIATIRDLKVRSAVSESNLAIEKQINEAKERQLEQARTRINELLTQMGNTGSEKDSRITDLTHRLRKLEEDSQARQATLKLQLQQKSTELDTLQETYNNKCGIDSTLAADHQQLKRSYQTLQQQANALLRKATILEESNERLVSSLDASKTLWEEASRVIGKC